MTDKIKYSSIVDKITKDLDKSPEFVAKLRKTMGEVLREGLEKDGSTHLSGFGTFYLKWSDAREGHNPQTGEKIDIPAHNHVSFRPDASVRRVINKEYDHLKAFILDENDKVQKTKIPGWIYAVLAVLLIAVMALLLKPKEIEEVIVTEEIVIVEEIIVTETIMVTNEIPVIEEIIITEEVIVIQESPVPTEAPVADAPASDASDIVNDINAMPHADGAIPPQVVGDYVDPDIAAAEAGMAAGLEVDAVNDAEIDAAKATLAEDKAEQHQNSVHAQKMAEKAEENAQSSEDAALEAIAKAIKAEDISDKATKAAEEGM